MTNELILKWDILHNETTPEEKDFHLISIAATVNKFPRDNIMLS